MLQTTFELFTVGDILDLRDEMQRPSLVVPDERRAQEHPDRVAPGVSVALLNLIGGDAPVEHLHSLMRVEVDIIRVRQVAEGARTELVGRIPGDPAQRVIDSQQPAGHVYERHADRRVRERVFKSATHRHPPSRTSKPVYGTVIKIADIRKNRCSKLHSVILGTFVLFRELCRASRRFAAVVFGARDAPFIRISRLSRWEHLRHDVVGYADAWKAR